MSALFLFDLVLAVLVSFLLITTAWLSSRRRSVSHIKGPAGAEWLVGHEHWLTHQMEANAHEMPLFKAYGNVLRTKGSFNQNILLVADPKAIQHIFQKTRYSFLKTNDELMIIESMFSGNGGLIASTGPNHARQRKILLPAFSAAQISVYMDIFQQVGKKLTAKWANLLASDGAVMNMSEWMAKASLEMVGETAFEYKFNSVDGAHKETELGAALDNMVADSQLFPSRYALLFNGILRVFPLRLCRLLNLLPSKQNDRFRQYRDAAENIVDRMLTDRRAKSDILEGKDVLSALIRANMAEDPSKRLGDSELVATLSTLIIAGHDTTATTITWMLWELAKNQQIQARLRAEIQEMYDRIGDGSVLSKVDYESMPILNATIKETLRYHSITITRPREASTDDVLPLSEPLMTTKGKVTEIPIQKGQIVHVHVAAYNRLTSVWGEDAEEWNPYRWLTQDRVKISDVGVGMTSNIMTFGAGVQGCIGWKFAMSEMQVMVTELIHNFEFTIPDSKPRILRLPTILLLPLVDGDLEAGVQMPLHVKQLTQELY